MAIITAAAIIFAETSDTRDITMSQTLGGFLAIMKDCAAQYKIKSMEKVV